jgi:hypothetical protein
MSRWVIRSNGERSGLGRRRVCAGALAGCCACISLHIRRLTMQRRVIGEWSGLGRRRGCSGGLAGCCTGISLGIRRLAVTLRVIRLNAGQLGDILVNVGCLDVSRSLVGCCMCILLTIMKLGCLVVSRLAIRLNGERSGLGRRRVCSGALAGCCTGISLVIKRLAVTLRVIRLNAGQFGDILVCVGCLIVSGLGRYGGCVESTVSFCMCILLTVR